MFSQCHRLTLLALLVSAALAQELPQASNQQDASNIAPAGDAKAPSGDTASLAAVDDLLAAESASAEDKSSQIQRQPLQVS